MALDRTALNAILATIVDDSGSGMDGTPWTKALIDSLFDATLDAVDVSGAITPGVQHVSLTGVQTIAVTSANVRVLRCTNAAPLRIDALTGGTEGQVVTVLACGAAAVEISNGTGFVGGILVGSSVAVITLAPGSLTPFHNGRAVILWDATTARWRVLHHEQGAWIQYAPVWGGTGTANTLGNGSITGFYHVRGRTCQFKVRLDWGSTTVAGNGVYTFTYPLPLVGLPPPGAVVLNDATVGAQSAVWVNYNGASFVIHNVGAPSGIQGSTPFVWATGDYIGVSGTYEVG